MRARQPAAVARPWLTGVDLDLRPGEVVGVLGPAGSGRTTLLRCLNGIVPGLVAADRTGAVSVAGIDPALVGVADTARVVATVLDDPEAQVTQLTVLDEVAFALENLGVPVDEIDPRAIAALSRVGLAGFEDRMPLTLSGGEQQRLAVACAIAMRPRVLVMDEPTANLDPRAARRVMRLAGDLAAGDPPAAVLIVSADADLLAESVDRVLRMREGRIVDDGPPSRVFADIARSSTDLAIPQVTQVAVRLEPDALELPVTVEAFVAWIRSRGG